MACFSVACGQPKRTVDLNADGGLVADPTDTFAEIEIDLVAEPSADAVADTPAATLGCPAGPGCPCAGNVDCNSALCLDTPEGKQCARTCIDSCPQGFACSAVDSGTGDLISVCVPRFGHLCNPCAAAKDCKSLGLSGSACVDEGDMGRFCGVACAKSDDCPTGYTCKAVKSVEGDSVQQCVRAADGGAADFGTCACSPAATTEHLQTACTVKSSVGGNPVACAGTRTCNSAGLSACVVASLGAEVCDGGDNDCNGQTDEGTCDDGQFCTTDACAGSSGCTNTPLDATPCDDGNPCTDGDACKLGICAPGASGCVCMSNADCAAKGDGNACNGTLYCDKTSLPWFCATVPGSVVTCADDSNPCHAAACDSETGKCEVGNVTTGTLCDDGDPCTQTECDLSGACTVTADTCGCKDNAACAKEEDGNLCNGTLFCDKSASPYKCNVNPATLVTCPNGQDPVCAENACNPGSGQCVMVPAGDKTACDDGNLCTLGDVCLGGQCVAGKNTCKCEKDSDCMAQEDGDGCNGTLFCNLAAGTCALNAATIVTCPSVDDSACGQNLCEPKTGKCAMVLAKDGTPCDDGDGCTVLDACQGGVCGGGANTCPCTSGTNCAAKEDGDFCNGTLYCDVVSGACKVNPATVVTCPSVDDSACGMAICQPKTGLCLPQVVTELTVCDDGNACTMSDTCSQGKCQSGTNTCSCINDADCVGKDDGDLCNGTLYCDLGSGACLLNPATTVTCPTVDDTACSHNVCQPQSGKCSAKLTGNGNPCDDGNPCTKGDACVSGLCKSVINTCGCKTDSDCAVFDDGNACNGTQVCAANAWCVTKASAACDDGDGCTEDACDKVNGCTNVANSAACNDGDACTSGDGCKLGSCAGGPAVNCADGQTCTDDGCDKSTGCHHVNNDAACEDGNACTLGDKCDGGTCTAGVQNACDDDKVCTDDFCAGTCKHVNNSNECDDGNACTTGEGCKAATCQGGAVTPCDDKVACTLDGCDQKAGCTFLAVANKCDDNKLCTVDSCDVGKDCQHVNLAGSTTCTDSSACTIGDHCNAGACLPGPVTPCDDGSGCTTDSCDTIKGCLFVINTLVCNDGDACTGSDKCAAGKCGGLVTSCDDGEKCTVDSCNSTTGCAHAQAGLTCGDGLCCGDETAPNCQTDCGFLLARLGGACTTPGTSGTCAAGFFCVARSAPGGGNVCVADFETWSPLPDAHPAADFQEFTDYVTDKRTGLTWSKESLAGMNWNDALTACAAKTYGGFSDWRLPTTAELFSLADRSKVNPACSAPKFVIPTVDSDYWSAIPWVSGGGWSVSLGNGSSSVSSTNNASSVQCVR